MIPGAIYLIGFMGSGKSTVGRRLAGELRRDFHDTDRLVELAEGRTVAEIFRDSGEACFRRLEWAALQRSAENEGAVVACGGGIGLGFAQRRWLRQHGRTVWLDAPLSSVRERLQHEPRAGSRPLWSADDLVGTRRLFERRRAAYALADLRVDASETPSVVVQRIRQALISPNCC